MNSTPAPWPRPRDLATPLAQPRPHTPTASPLAPVATPPRGIPCPAQHRERPRHVYACVRASRPAAGPGSGAVSRCYAAGREVSAVSAARGPAEGMGERERSCGARRVTRGRAVRPARRWGPEEGPRVLRGLLGPVPSARSGALVAPRAGGLLSGGRV